MLVSGDSSFFSLEYGGWSKRGEHASHLFDRVRCSGDGEHPPTTLCIRIPSRFTVRHDDSLSLFKCLATKVAGNTSPQLSELERNLEAGACAPASRRLPLTLSAAHIVRVLPNLRQQLRMLESG